MKYCPKPFRPVRCPSGWYAGRWTMRHRCSRRSSRAMRAVDAAILAHEAADLEAGDAIELGRPDHRPLNFGH